MKAFAKFSWVAISILLIGLAGCSSNSSKNIESNLRIKGAPDWVNEGTRAVNDKNGRLVHGVGSAPKLGDESLQKTTADNRARTEIARVISTFIDSSIADFSAANGETVDAAVSREIKSSTVTLLSGARIMGRWKDKKSGDIYSFAELDLKKIEDAVAKAEVLNANLKDYISKDLTTNFERFVTGVQ